MNRCDFKTEIPYRTVWPTARIWDRDRHVDAYRLLMTIYIDPDAWQNNGATSIAENTRVGLDRNCLIGPQMPIFDCDFHTLDPKRCTSGKHDCAAVHLQENVLFSSSATILKGVTAGRNSVIAAGAVVVAAVPNNNIVAGAPARVVRLLSAPHSAG